MVATSRNRGTPTRNQAKECTQKETPPVPDVRLFEDAAAASGLLPAGAIIDRFPDSISIFPSVKERPGDSWKVTLPGRFIALFSSHPGGILGGGGVRADSIKA